MVRALVSHIQHKLLRQYARIVAIALDAHQDSTVRTSLRFIDQTLSAKELLLSSGEDKSLVAVPTVDILVLENHSVPPVI